MSRSETGKQPQWLEWPLQGLAFWIGHRRSIYRDYPLGESSLVAELSNLIFAHLPSELELRCEVPLADIIGRPVAAEFGVRPRADLVICSRSNKDGGGRDGTKKVPPVSATAQTVIEVKRAKAPTKEILHDMQRLAMLREARPKLRTYLIVASEAHQPSHFVTEKGLAVPGWRSINLKSGHESTGPARFHVRRVCKASASFDKRDAAHYVCLLEVESPATGSRRTR